MRASEADAGDEAVSPDETERLQRALEEERHRGRQLLADFENFRRRAAREQEGTHQEGRRAALLPLLPVVDALERALAAGSTDPAFYEGVAATHRMFIDALRKAGAEPVESSGRRFDPTVHEAVGTVSGDGMAPGTIAHELRRGWRLGSELLRPAQVVVVTGQEDSDSWQ